jgi:hypothetical protein
MENINTYADITEMIYYSSHDNETDEEIVPEVQPIDVKFDVKFLIDQALDNRDLDMLEWLVRL